jgi:hypothetical protein
MKAGASVRKSSPLTLVLVLVLVVVVVDEVVSGVQSELFLLVVIISINKEGQAGVVALADEEPPPQVISAISAKIATQGAQYAEQVKVVKAGLIRVFIVT